MTTNILYTCIISLSRTTIIKVPTERGTYKNPNRTFIFIRPRNRKRYIDKNLQEINGPNNSVLINGSCNILIQQ